LPGAIVSAIESDSGSTDTDSRSQRLHFILLDNQSALEAAAAAARQRGFTTEIARDISDQPIEAGCRQLLRRLSALRIKAKATEPTETNVVCLVSGGEFACPVRGEGLGGRNLESALRLATGQGLSEFVALCAGTDGIDGNSPAAGAIVDHTTSQRARAIGLDPLAFIERSDAYSFFVALGDTIATGVTGTNVRDVRILLQACG
jgi:glycerate-2-kinase